MAQTRTAVVDLVTVGAEEQCCQGWNVCACTHPGNPKNEQDGKFGGDGGTWAVTLMAE